VNELLVRERRGEWCLILMYCHLPVIVPLTRIRSSSIMFMCMFVLMFMLTDMLHVVIYVSVSEYVVLLLLLLLLVNITFILCCWISVMIFFAKC
jgi:hypothetical protein